ncbi:hypothetical protein OG21DRAFT_1274184 [Imleria badia]|nr:hypothetical protein OG21DRAFT_1274184 [Imleria badia]
MLGQTGHLVHPSSTTPPTPPTQLVEAPPSPPSSSSPTPSPSLFVSGASQASNSPKLYILGFHRRKRRLGSRTRQYLLERRMAPPRYPTMGKPARRRCNSRPRIPHICARRECGSYSLGDCFLAPKS